ncbi:hypothetical protein [Streptomyces sp. NPDC006739]|uniref:hypothetical protein n=1 Tax=Streptomyces sp. NPDC006739 TaxID=3364763 RepID=UPI0036C9516E
MHLGGPLPGFGILADALNEIAGFGVDNPIREHGFVPGRLPFHVVKLALRNGHAHPDHRGTLHLGPGLAGDNFSNWYVDAKDREQSSGRIVHESPRRSAQFHEKRVEIGGASNPVVQAVQAARVSIAAASGDDTPLIAASGRRDVVTLIRSV